MDKIKKYAKYIIWIVLFWIFSDILIFFGLNASYDKITPSSNSNIPSQVEIERAEATLVNGRIKGKIKNDGDEDLNGKYMKVDLFSPQNVLLGTKYMKLDDFEKGAEKDFEIFFKAQDVDHYDISFVDEIEPKEQDELDKALQYLKEHKKLKFDTEFLNEKLSGPEIVYLLFLLMIIGA